MSVAQQLSDVEELLRRLSQLALEDDLPDGSTPLGQMTREFFGNSWETCRDGLLQKTQRIRIHPEASLFPRRFRFDMDLPWKRQIGSADDPVELMPGPVRGMIIYRADLLANLHEPGIAVRLDSTTGYFHPNFSRKHGLLCLGDTTGFGGPVPLDVLLENHLYPVLSYQNRSPRDPADLEAARYFALNPGAMAGLEPVPPLY